MHGMHSEWYCVRKEQRYEMETQCYSNCVYSLPTDLDKENERKKKQKRPELIKEKKIQIVILVTSPGLFEKAQKE